MWSAFVAGYTILLRQFGVRLTYAALGAGCLLFSHFVQVWWTSNAPAFAFAPWPTIAFLLPLRWYVKLPLVTWLSCVWIFSLVYPPFIIPAAFAMVTLILAFRQDVLNKVDFAVGGMVLLLVAILFYSYFGDLIGTMSATIYPGQRVSAGGGVETAKILAHVFPYFTTINFDPLLAQSNECEIAVVASMLPLALVVFAKYESIYPVIRENLMAIAIILGGLSLMLMWITIPISPDIGKLLLWNYVEPKRMVWGFGLLLTLALLVFGTKLEFDLSSLRMIVFAGVVTVSWLVSKIVFATAWMTADTPALAAITEGWFDLVPIAVFFCIIFGFKLPRMRKTTPANVTLASVFVSGLLTFGSFNPVQSAHSVFSAKETELVGYLESLALENPNGWVALPGLYGALLSGFGVSSINHVLPSPQLDFFHEVFPELPTDELHALFNRYAHIVPQDIEQPYSPQADVVLVPISRFQEDLSANLKALREQRGE